MSRTVSTNRCQSEEKGKRACRIRGAEQLGPSLYDFVRSDWNLIRIRVSTLLAGTSVIATSSQRQLAADQDH